MGTLERAIEVAAAAHAGQIDKAGEPYILHPLRMVVHAMAGGQTDIAIVAALHDVIEDTELTLGDLRREGFPERCIKAVDALTRRRGEDYSDFIRRAAKNRIARIVKGLDIDDNANPSRLAKIEDEKQMARLATKYAMARDILNGVQ